MLEELLLNIEKSWEYYHQVSENVYLKIIRKNYIKTIEIYKNSKWEKIEKSTFKTRWDAFRLNINFDDRIEKVKVSFIDNLADDYIIDIKYQEADKEKYYAKNEQESKDNLL